jgi:hypothetical protein
VQPKGAQEAAEEGLHATEGEGLLAAAAAAEAEDVQTEPDVVPMTRTPRTSDEVIRKPVVS